MAIYDQGSAGGNYNAPGAGFIGGPPAAPTPKPKPKPKPPSVPDYLGSTTLNPGFSQPGAGGIPDYLGGTTLNPGFSPPGSSGPTGPASPPTYQGGTTPPVPVPQVPEPPKPTIADTDPQVLINKLLEQLGIGTIDSNLKALRERAIINWGDPALAAMAGFGLDPQAGAFAQQNYLSGNAALAKINKQHDLNSKAIVNRLASRGLLRSGDLGYQKGQEDQAYSSNQYEGRQAILDYLTKIAQDAQDRKNALRQSVIQSVMAAYQNMAQNPAQYATWFGG